MTSGTRSTPSDCLTEIKSWMRANFLKLNCDKSDMIAFLRPALLFLKVGNISTSANKTQKMTK